MAQSLHIQAPSQNCRHSYITCSMQADSCVKEKNSNFHALVTCVQRCCCESKSALRLCESPASWQHKDTTAKLENVPSQSQQTKQYLWLHFRLLGEAQLCLLCQNFQKYHGMSFTRLGAAHSPFQQEPTISSHIALELINSQHFLNISTVKRAFEFLSLPFSP